MAVSFRRTIKDQDGINSHVGEVGQLDKCPTDRLPPRLVVAILVTALVQEEVAVEVVDVQAILRIPCPPPSIRLQVVVVVLDMSSTQARDILLPLRV